MDDLDKIRKDIPDEFIADFDKILDILTKRFCDNLKEIQTAMDKYAPLSDKELGLHLNEIKSDIARKFIFSMRKGRFLKQLSEPSSMIRRSFMEFMRPTANRLEGYTPTSSMVRIEQEA